MISAVTPELAISATVNLRDYRNRPAMGERTMLPDSTKTAPTTPGAGEDSQFAKSQHQAPPQPELPRKDPSAMFAAAVIAGALSPTPKTMEELMQRIGTSTIPEESEARLKDLLA